jgi:hypothetical protein
MQQVAAEFARQEDAEASESLVDPDYWCFTCRNKKPQLKAREKLYQQKNKLTLNNEGEVEVKSHSSHPNASHSSNNEVTEPVQIEAKSGVEVSDKAKVTPVAKRPSRGGTRSVSKAGGSSK